MTDKYGSDDSWKYGSAMSLWGVHAKKQLKKLKEKEKAKRKREKAKQKRRNQTK